MQVSGLGFNLGSHGFIMSGRLFFKELFISLEGWVPKPVPEKEESRI